RGGRIVTAATATVEPGGSAPPARLRRRGGRVLLWVAIVLVVVFGALPVWAAARGSTAGRHDRSPTDPGEGATTAHARVLEQQGIDVALAHSYGEARAALGDGANAPLLVDDDWWVLTDHAYSRVLDLAAHTVLVQPSDGALELLEAGVSYAGFAGGVLEPGCPLPAAQRAGTVS